MRPGHQHLTDMGVVVILVVIAISQHIAAGRGRVGEDMYYEEGKVVNHTPSMQVQTLSRGLGWWGEGEGKGGQTLNEGTMTSAGGGFAVALGSAGEALQPKEKPWWWCVWGGGQGALTHSIH